MTQTQVVAIIQKEVVNKTQTIMQPSNRRETKTVNQTVVQQRIQKVNNILNSP